MKYFVADAVYKSHDKDVNAVAIAPNEKFILTGSEDVTIIQWDTRSGEKLMTYAGHNSAVCAISILPNGLFFITGSKDNTAIRWDLYSGEQLNVYEGHSGTIAAVAILPNGDFFVTGSYDNTAIKWDVHSSEKLVTYRGHRDAVNTIIISPNGDFLITGSSDFTAIKWDILSGEKLMIYEGHRGSVSTLAISSSGEFFITGSSDRTAIQWDIKSGQKVVNYKGHSRPILALAISPSEEFLITGGEDNTVIQWSIQSGDQIQKYYHHSSYIRDIKMSQTGEFFITSSKDNTAIKWDIWSDEKLATIPLVNHGGQITAVKISQSGNFIITGSCNGTLLKWDMRSGELRMTYKGHTKEVSVIEISSSEEFFIACSKDTVVFRWDVRSGQMLMKYSGHLGPVSSAAISRQGDFFITGSSDQTIIKWDIKSGEKLFTYNGHDEGVMAVAISQSQDFFVSGSEYNIMIQWDLMSNKRLVTFDDVTYDFITNIAMSTNGTALITGSDKSVFQLDLRSGEKARLTCFDYIEFSSYVAISPDGTFYVTVNSNNMVYQWDCASKEKVRSWDTESLFTFKALNPTSIAISSCCHYVVIGYKNGEIRTLRVDQPIDSSRDLNMREDRPDLIIHLVKQLQIQKASTRAILDNGEKLKMTDDFKVHAATHLDELGVFLFSSSIFPVTPYYIPVEDIASIDSEFLNVVIQHASTLNRFDVFDNEVVKYLVMFKWETYAKHWFLLDFGLTIILSVLFLVHSVVYYYYSRQDNNTILAFGCVLLVLTFCLSLYFLYHEICQLFVARSKCKIKEYLCDSWNQLHLSTNILSITTLIIQAVSLSSSNTENDASVILSAIVMPLLACEILFYLGGLKSTGSLVRMITKILSGIQGLIFILVVMVIFFAGSYTVLFRANPEEGYEEFDATLLTVYGYLFGNYNVPDFDTAVSPVLAKLLISLFLFFVVIVLLNLLIALMGDIFDEVQARASSEATYGIAKLVLEYEGLFSTSYKEKNKNSFFPRCLFVLKKDGEKGKASNGDSGWKGRTEEIRRELLSNRSEMQSKLNSLDSSITFNCSEIKNELSALRSENEKILQMIKDLLAK